MRKRKKSGGGGAAWLVTFSDLMTLLLTFFVLLLSMASMDTTKISRINAFSDEQSPIMASGAVKIPYRISLVFEMLKEPAALLEKQELLKDLLFPDEVLPKNLPRATLEENLAILERPDGVAMVLTEKLLFMPGSAYLTSTAKTVLHELTPLLHYTSADINIAGFTDNMQDELAAEQATDSYTLSGQRALAVLEFFVAESIAPERFSLSGYGPDRPLSTKADAREQAKNRRVEILLKTSQWLGKYQ